MRRRVAVGGECKCRARSTHVRVNSHLDFSCFFHQSLARLGGAVLGVDAAAASIRVAEMHAARDPLLSDRLRYSCATAESLLASSQRYDVVCALEVVEHVAHAPSFLRTLAQLTAPGGLLFISTLNQTGKSWLMAIVGAEYVLRWVPVGTHDWHRFLSPATLASLVEQAHSDPSAPTTPLLPKQSDFSSANSDDASPISPSAAASRAHLRVLDVCGMRFDPLTERWSLQPEDTDCNYILTATRANQTIKSSKECDNP
jgi:ubiquinone biosynthesis O-methyltransferase